MDLTTTFLKRKRECPIEILETESRDEMISRILKRLHGERSKLASLYEDIGRSLKNVDEIIGELKRARDPIPKIVSEISEEVLLNSENLPPSDVSKPVEEQRSVLGPRHSQPLPMIENVHATVRLKSFSRKTRSLLPKQASDIVITSSLDGFLQVWSQKEKRSVRPSY